jgi:hypothetical protein
MNSFPDDFNAVTVNKTRNIKYNKEQEELLCYTRKLIVDTVTSSTESNVIIELPSNLAHTNKLKLVNELVGKFKIKVLKNTDVHSGVIFVDGLLTSCPSFKAIKLNID